MKVLIIPNNVENGCYTLRNKMPGEELRKRGHEVLISNSFESYFHPQLMQRVLDPSNIDWCDVVVFSRHYEIDTATIRNLILYAKANGKRVVYETDDLIDGITPDNPGYQVIYKSAAQVKMMALMADVCTTTTPELAEELKRFNGNVKVCPNTVIKEDWKLRKGGNKKLRIGWAGGSSHAADLLTITSVIEELQKEHDFEFVILGLVPVQWDEYIKKAKAKHEKDRAKNDEADAALWYTKMIELDEALKKIKWEHHPFVPVPEYAKKLSELNLDIGVCPLVDTRFNRSKSSIKFYEYAMVGTATVASKIPPYKGEVGYCAKNTAQWKSKLLKLITEPETRKELTDTQRQWVLDNRQLKNNIHLWEEAYHQETKASKSPLLSRS